MKHIKKSYMDSQGLIKNETGMIIVMAVLLLTVVLLFAVTATITATSEARFSGRSYQESQVFYAAEGVAEYGIDALNNFLQVNLDPTQAQLDQLTLPTPPSGYQLNQYTLHKIGDFYPIVITTGDYAGLNAYVQQYEVICNVSRSNQHARITRGIEHQFIPLFQFGVFYQDDLEMFPGPSMTFAGRVHSNGDIYVGAGTDLYFNSYVTAVGQIWHFRKDGSAVSAGPVYFKDYWGVNRNMNVGSYWLDSSRPTWQTESISRWGGTVRDSSHSVRALDLPIPDPSHNQIEIIQRGLFTDPPELRDARYYWKASIRVINGVAYDTMGNVINMGSGTLGAGSFYDQREQRTMHTTELDIGDMISHGTSPPNGIIYISGSNLGDAVRIVNAATIPVGGLTIASDNPIYILGNYNRTPKRPSSIVGDAVTVLSANWRDNKSTQSYTNRVACETWVNGSIMTGNRETILNGGYDGNYNGGLENVIRFLEKWENIWIHYRGSINDLWYSAQATGAWRASIYYSAPKRDWGFDTDLLAPNNWPPGVPQLHTVQRGTWRQIG